jgi:uncharacterized membrane protein
MATLILYGLVSMFFAVITSVIREFDLKRIQSDLGLKNKTTIVFL